MIMAKEIGCVNFQGLLEYLRRHHGDAAVGFDNPRIDVTLAYPGHLLNLPEAEQEFIPPGNEEQTG